MPVQSMTGFSFSKVSIDGNDITCEIRSVNSKFLDITFKASDKSSIFEVYTLSQLKKIFSRGKIEVKLSNYDQSLKRLALIKLL